MRHGKVLLMKREPIAREEAAKKLCRVLAGGDPALDTQDKIAKKAGVSQKTVSNLKNTDNLDMEGPTLASVEKVAHALDMEAWELLKPEAVNGTQERNKKSGAELTSTQKEVLDYLKDPGVADAVLRLLKPKPHRGKVRLMRHGNSSSTTASTRTQHRKGS